MSWQLTLFVTRVGKLCALVFLINVKAKVRKATSKIVSLVIKLIRII